MFNLDAPTSNLAKLHTQIHRKKNFFPGQRDSEEVQLCIRIHWIQRAKIFIWFLLLGILLPGTIYYFISRVGLPTEIWSLFSLVVIFYFLFSWLITFIEFIKSEFTLLVATNERIADIAQSSIFDQQISETNLDRIQEVSGYTHGFWKTFLNVGNLEIQTAGSDIPLVMRLVKSPQLTARKILDVQRESQQRRRGSDFGKRSEDEIQTRKGEVLSEEELKKLRGGGIANGDRQRKPHKSV
ncbi:PH domain-containing protein [Candidatus Gracilibacteria bacterium]|nr:PH domain-containing protein [Candidatus Gracilibacteria bacterium]MCF7896800.1 PH domain-containing protein [Candidatus Gracilibacteria bacterium]